MTEKIYSLPFVNDGEAFAMPDWTVEKHKSAMANLLKNTIDMSDLERDQEYKYYVVFETLKEIDKAVSMDNIKPLHPEDIIELFQAVYNAGKIGIYTEDFRKGNRPRLNKKSTGKKNTKN